MEDSRGLDERQSDGLKNARLGGLSRPTIGLFIVNTSTTWAMLEWQGAMDAAQEWDVNLICFSGRELYNLEDFGTQANVLYDLVDVEKIDGLFLAGGLASRIGRKTLRDFCGRYSPLPIVTTEIAIEGIPNVGMDFYQSMHEALIHLIEGHGYRRIAFVMGLPRHLGHQERYRAYTETLAEYSLPFDPNLVLEREWAGDEGVGSWPLGGQGDDVEVIVGVDDFAALRTLRGLQARGVRIPDDVAVIGFDDDVKSKTVTPPLTTVRPPFYERGRQAVGMLLALMEGKEVPKQVILPSQFVVRQSCGCESPAVVQITAGLRSAAGRMKVSRKKFKAILSTQGEEILAGMTQAMGELGGSLNPRWARQLLDGFAAELGGHLAGAFLATLDEVLRQVVTTGGDVTAWHGALSVLRRHCLPYLDGEMLSRADDLWQQARVAIEETAQRKLAYQQLQAEQQAQTGREIGASLITTFGVEELLDVLAEELPRLGMPSAYLCLYEDPQPYEYPQPAPKWSRLLLAYDEAGAKRSKRVELEPERQRFFSRWLLPESILWPERRYTMVAEALHFREEQLGFALFEVGPREGRIYETLRGEISSALFGAFLLQERQRAEAALAQAYTEVEQQVEERTHDLQQEIMERKRTEKQLKRYRAHLEELVVARTRELEEAQAELVRQERLSALGQLTATVAHEIRNPLGTVRTSVFAINRAIERDEMDRVERALQLAERNIVRCDNIISELLDYTRDRVLQLKPTPIDGWLNQVLDEQTLPEDIVCIRELRANVKASTFEVSIDREHLRRAIINVVNNAVEAMQEEVGRSLERIEEEYRLTVSTQVVGDRLEIRISDTGDGISDEVMDKLFEPLFSTRSFGVGLGMSIVKNIMEQHDGGVEIQSKLGEGTSVTLWLPISNDGKGSRR